MIEIEIPKMSTSAGRYRLSADISVDGQTNTLWFEVEEKFGRYLCHERSDAFVLAMLQYAFRHGHDIKSKSPMTDRLYGQLTEQFLPAFNKINRLTTKIFAPVAPEVEHPEDGCRIGTGLSCGVDSLHVYATRPEIDIACVWSAGVIAEVRKREAYEKPSVKRKKKSEAARKRKYN